MLADTVKEVDYIQGDLIGWIRKKNDLWLYIQLLKYSRWLFLLWKCKCKNRKAYGKGCSITFKTHFC